MTIAQWGGCYGGGMMGGGTGWTAVGWLFTIVFWLAIVLLVIWLFKQLRKPGEDPMEVLKRRYASGELTKERYEEMKRELER